MSDRPSPPRLAAWTWLGQIPFDDTVRVQEALRAAVLRGEDREMLLLCEHDPVITLGRRARAEDLLLDAAEYARRGIAVRPASRGGEVTYHGPGQLVAYPVIRLRRGVLAHVEGMARAVIALLAEYGVAGEWRRADPGVWVDDAKICAVGVHVRRGVALHGLALNVALPLDPFATIVPCGHRDGRVTTLAAHVSSNRGATSPGLHPAALAAPLATALGRELGLEFHRVSPESVEQVPDCKIEIVTDMMERA